MSDPKFKPGDQVEQSYPRDPVWADARQQWDGMRGVVVVHTSPNTEIYAWVAWDKHDWATRSTLPWSPCHESTAHLRHALISDSGRTDEQLVALAGLESAMRAEAEVTREWRVALAALNERPEEPAGEQLVALAGLQNKRVALYRARKRAYEELQCVYRIDP